MDNIFRGNPIEKVDFINKLIELKDIILQDLVQEPLAPNVIIEACHQLSTMINQQEVVCELILMGIPKWAAEDYVKTTVNSLNRYSLTHKLKVELGEEAFNWRRVSEEFEEKNQPLGVLMHIGAGNSLGLSAFSVIEGLLTGNINILKLPKNEGGISSRLLLELVKLEPRLKPYIYVLDVSSKNSEVIGQLVEIANAVIVWGSDEAIKAIRQLVPPSLPIIEWGHKLSFAYFTKGGNIAIDLEGLARDICLTDQLYCSSPQCVLYEIDSFEELDDFAIALAKQLEVTANEYPAAERPIDVQSQITWVQELIRVEELLGEKRLITNIEKQYSVLVDYKPQLKPAPLFRNIWVMPVKRKELLGILRSHKGHLQTVGLSCGKGELEELSGLLCAAGLCRITTCGFMSVNYAGEPHDGIRTLERYIRRVSRRLTSEV